MTSLPKLCALLLFLPVPIVAQTNFDLSGSWQYQLVTNLTYPPPANWLTTTVPGYISSTNYARAWFRKTFALPSLPAGCRVKLQFGGVNYNSTVYLNGQPIGSCYNGYDPFELDASAAASPGQTNELLVALTDWTGLFSAPVDFSNLQPGESARDRANNVILTPIGGRFELFGIWEPVTVKYSPTVSIDEVFVMPSVRQQQLKVHAKVRNDSQVAVSATLRHRVLGQSNAVLVLPDLVLNLPAGQSLDVETNVPWPSPRLWTQEDPCLYLAESTLTSPGLPTDTVQTRFGFRELWTSGDSFFLNGTRLHLLATSCWPPTAPTTDATIRQSLLDVKAGNTASILAARHAHGQVQQTPALVALAGAPENHLAALVQHPLEDLRWRSRSHLNQLPQTQNLRQRRRHHTQVNGDVHLLAHFILSATRPSAIPFLP